MGNMFMQSLVVMCDAVTETAGQSGGQFPFLAALILVAIIAVVSIGDMAATKKNKDEQTSKEDDNQDNNAKM